MKHKKKIKQAFEYVHKIQCDKCLKSFDERDFIEWQESVSIDMVGGYGSVFGDGAKISIDLCQSCFKELCGGFISVT